MYMLLSVIDAVNSILYKQLMISPFHSVTCRVTVKTFLISLVRLYHNTCSYEIIKFI